MQPMEADLYPRLSDRLNFTAPTVTIVCAGLRTSRAGCDSPPDIYHRVPQTEDRPVSLQLPSTALPCLQASAESRRGAHCT